jgi:hypothetical protein
LWLTINISAVSYLDDPHHRHTIIDLVISHTDAVTDVWAPQLDSADGARIIGKCVDGCADSQDGVGGNSFEIAFSS